MWWWWVPDPVSIQVRDEGPEADGVESSARHHLGLGLVLVLVLGLGLGLGFGLGRFDSKGANAALTLDW